MRVILASSSPRRKEILNLIGLKKFEVVPPKVKEKSIKTPADVVGNAYLKGRYVEKLLKPKGETLIIASDTAVFINGKFLGKPKNREEAKEMLKTLSGKWHKVHTAVVLIYKNKNRRRVLRKLFTTAVKFKKLTDREIDWYLSTGEPMDKAGAYGIQGYGAIFIEKLKGDYFTVMGLPASGLYKMLKEVLGEEKTLNLLKVYP
jgi:septum formation protein